MARWSQPAAWRQVAVGQRFGHLTFLGATERTHIGNFRCDCGVVKSFWIRNVLIYGTKSCGCMSKSFRCPKGIKFTDEHRANLRGKKWSKKHRENLANSLRGRRLSVQHKQKLALQSRKLWAERTAVGITRVDRGATEYFNNLNLHCGFHIQHPNIYFPELGYFADGYDPILHAWFEYDTPSHLAKAYRERDEKRQTEIVEHFKQKGKPLTVFYRVNRTGRGESGLQCHA